jgi:DME family drug/metabolite transporter
MVPLETIMVIRGLWRNRTGHVPRGKAILNNVNHRHDEPNQKPYYAGLALVFLAALLWSLNGALIKLVNREGQGPDAVTIAFYRSLFAGLFLLPLVRGRYRTLRPPPGAASRLPIRSSVLVCVLFFTLMTVFFVAANVMTEAANAIILQYTSTFWVFGLSPLILRERPGKRAVAILILAMAGIGIIFAGNLLEAENMRADLLSLIIALASGLFYGLLTMMIRQTRESDSAAVTVMNNLGSALLILPFAFLLGDLLVSARSLGYLVFMGVVQFGVPYYLFTLGLARIPAYQGALITLAEPVLVPVWTYLAVGEKVPVPTASGGAVIMLALVLFVLVAKQPATAKPAME